MQLEMEKSPENLDKYMGKGEEVTEQDIQI